MSNFYIKQDCRLCGSKNIEIVLPLQKSPLCDAYLERQRKQEFYDLNLCLCNECSFVQIDTVIDPETIYRDYIYVTKSSPGLQKHFKEYSADVCNLSYWYAVILCASDCASNFRYETIVNKIEIIPFTHATKYDPHI